MLEFALYFFILTFGASIRITRDTCGADWHGLSGLGNFANQNASVNLQGICHMGQQGNISPYIIYNLGQSASVPSFSSVHNAHKAPSTCHLLTTERKHARHQANGLSKHTSSSHIHQWRCMQCSKFGDQGRKTPASPKLQDSSSTALWGPGHCFTHTSNLVAGSFDNSK